MDSRIKGIDVVLYTKTASGVDAFNETTYTEEAKTISNVLVYPTSATENLELTNLYGRKAVYTLAIPKDDTNTWENCKVSFFGENWRVFGIPQMGIEDNIPLAWNKKVTVERYE